jgi:hypothetical protein
MAVWGASTASEMGSQLKEPPRTPVRKGHWNTTTPPGLSLASKPGLLRALETQSFFQVSRVLRQDPAAATDLFWDHACEAPLDAAMRLGCSAEIVEMLLEYGADPGSVNRHGRTPAEAFQKLGKQHFEETKAPQVPDERIFFDDYIAFSNMTPLSYPPPWSPIAQFCSCDLLNDQVKIHQAVKEILS